MRLRETTGTYLPLSEAVVYSSACVDVSELPVAIRSATPPPDPMRNNKITTARPPPAPISG
jgi:hypothetical protein